MKYILLLLVVSIAFFAIFPDIDLKISGFFYEEEKGFIYRDNFVLVFIYKLIRVLTYAVIIGLFTISILKRIKPSISFPTYRQIIFLALILVIGPGLIVHQGFKDNWERARPVNIKEFGGSKNFSPPLQIADQNGHSFLSGHTSMGFYMVAFAFLWQGAKRRKIYIAALGFGAITGAARIMQGGHFLSDTIFSALVVLLVIHLFYRLIKPTPA